MAKKKNSKCAPHVDGITDHPQGDAIREMMTMIGDKWSIFLIVALSKRPRYKARFSELEKLVPSISQRMLSATLKELEHNGFVSREVFPEIPPRVEYELTQLGLSVFEPLRGIIAWVQSNWGGVEKARTRGKGAP